MNHRKLPSIALLPETPLGLEGLIVERGYLVVTGPSSLRDRKWKVISSFRHISRVDLEDSGYDDPGDICRLLF